MADSATAVQDPPAQATDASAPAEDAPGNAVTETPDPSEEPAPGSETTGAESGDETPPAAEQGTDGDPDPELPATLTLTREELLTHPDVVSHIETEREKEVQRFRNRQREELATKEAVVAQGQSIFKTWEDANPEERGRLETYLGNIFDQVQRSQAAVTLYGVGMGAFEKYKLEPDAQKAAVAQLHDLNIGELPTDATEAQVKARLTRIADAAEIIVDEVVKDQVAKHKAKLDADFEKRVKAATQKELQASQQDAQQHAAQTTEQPPPATGGQAPGKPFASPSSLAEASANLHAAEPGSPAEAAAKQEMLRMAKAAS